MLMVVYYLYLQPPLTRNHGAQETRKVQVRQKANSIHRNSLLKILQAGEDLPAMTTMTMHTAAIRPDVLIVQRRTPLMLRMWSCSELPSHASPASLYKPA